MNEAIKKALASATGRAKGEKSFDADFEAECPTVHAFLTEVSGDNGRTRKTATLLLFADDGGFKACLNEREQELTLWASSDTIQGAWKELEALLGQQSVPWKRSSGGRTKPWERQGKKNLDKQ